MHFVSLILAHPIVEKIIRMVVRKFKLSKLFSWTIYVLGVANITLFSVFFYNLSRLTGEELNDSQYIDFSFWADYIGWLFFVILGVYLHYSEQEFPDQFSRVFDVNNILSAKIATVFFCRLVPAVFLTFLLFGVIRRLGEIAT